MVLLNQLLVTSKKKDENQPLTPDWLFEKRSKVLFKLHYCPSNEHDVRRFIGIIESFTGGKIMLIILWLTRKLNLCSHIKTNLPIYLANL